MLTGLCTALHHLASEQCITLGQQATDTAAVQIRLNQLRGERGVIAELGSIRPYREQLINAINAQPGALHLKHHVDRHPKALKVFVHAVDGHTRFGQRRAQVVQQL